MKIIGIITRIGQVALVILWMAACSGGGGQSGNDFAVNGPTAEKGGNSGTSDRTTKEARDGDQGGSSEGHQESDTREHDDDETSDEGADKKDKKDTQEADHSSTPANNGTDQSVGAASGGHGQDGHDAYDSGSEEGGVDHNAENSSSNGNGPGNSQNALNADAGTGGTGNNQQEEIGSAGTADANDRSEDNAIPGNDGEFAIVTAQDQQNQIRVTYVPLVDRFLAVWNDLRAGEGWHVYGRLVNAEGVGHGPLKAFSPSGVERRTAPSVAHDPATGRSLIVWGTASGDVVGRLVDQAGDGVGALVPLASSAVWEGEPSVGFDPDGGRYVVVWIEANPSFTLYAQGLDRDGRLIGSPIPITEVASGKLDLRMATDSDSGRHLVVWRDYRGVDIYSIRGHMLGPDGRPASGEIVIADAEGSQINPELAYDSARRAFLVTWSDSRRTGAYELFGQVVASPDGMLIGSNVLISPSGGYPHTISMDAGRSLYVVLYPKAGLRLHGQYVAPDGVVEGDEFAIASTETAQSFPHATPNQSGRGFLASWTDQREGAPHLFGRMLAPGVAGLDPAVAAPTECPDFRASDDQCLDCEANVGRLVDDACPLDAAYTNHGEYLGCVTDRVNALRQEGRIGGACKLALIAPRARSTVGR